MIQDQSQSSFGLAPNVAAGLAALFGWVGGLVIILGKPPQQWVRFVAVQSIVLGVVYIAILIGLNILGFILALAHLGILSLILLPVEFVLFVVWVIATLITAISAFQGKTVRLPFIAPAADKYVPASTAL